MQSVQEQYTRELFEQWRYFATWAPNVPLSLGDVGVLRRHEFDRITSLTHLKVKFTTRDAGVPADYTYLSAGQVDVSLDGEVPALSLAGGDAPLTLTVSFNRAHATYFHAAQCTSEAIADLAALEQELVKLQAMEQWRPEYVVVTELVRSGPTIVLVSNQAGARTSLRVTADSLPLQAGPAATVNAAATSGVGTSVIDPHGGLTPLFRAARLRRSIGGRRRITIRTGNEEPGEKQETWSLGTASWYEFSHDSES